MTKTDKMTCDQCGRTGFNGTRGLAMHVGRVHTKKVDPNAHKRTTRKSKLDISKSVQIMALDTREVSVGTVLPRNPALRIDFCPGCAFPIKIVDDALASLETRSNFCPGCAFPVRLLHSAVKFANKHNIQ